MVSFVCQTVVEQMYRCLGLGATVGSLTYPALDCWRVVALAEGDMDSSSESTM